MLPAANNNVVIIEYKSVIIVGIHDCLNGTGCVTQNFFNMCHIKCFYNFPLFQL